MFEEAAWDVLWDVPLSYDGTYDGSDGGTSWDVPPWVWDAPMYAGLGHTRMHRSGGYVAGIYVELSPLELASLLRLARE